MLQYVMGYDQAKVVELGLGLDDLFVIDWLNYRLNKGGSIKYTPYKTFTDDCPFFSITKQYFDRIMDRLIEKGIFECTITPSTVKYKLGVNYFNLIGG